MVFTDISIFERVGRRNANIASTVALALLLLLLIFKQLPLKPEIPKDELGGGGVTVALGWPDAGSQNDTPTAGGGEPVPPEETKVTPASPPPTPAAPSSGVATSEDSEVDYAAIAKKKEENRKKKQEIDDANKKVLDDARVATEVKRRADEAENAKKAEADAYNKKKSGFGDLYNKPGAGGSGKGSGNSGKPGNGGDPNGDPNSSNLEGSGGSGGGKGGGNGTGVGTDVGGGISNRGKLGSSAVPKSYNENGDVVVNVCLNADGSVDASSVKVVNKGTTTTSITLRNLATNNARSYRFNKGDDNQCGTITYHFRVK
jgi:hypothetical protein